MSKVDRSYDLVIATDKDSEIAFAQSAADASQVPLKIFSKMAEAIQHLGDGSILILDLSLIDSVSLPSNFPMNQVHLLTMDSDFRTLSRHFGVPPYGNFILRKFADMAVPDGALYSRVLKKGFHFKESGLIGSNFSKEQIETVRFEGITQKRFAATSVGYFLMENGFNAQLSDTVGLAIDELLMNAMLDAEAESDGGLSLNDVCMEVGLDGEVLGVNIVDSHGSLDRMKLLRHLKSNFSQEANEVRGVDKDGAGLGLTQILRSGGSLLFRVVPGRTTEVTVFFRRLKSFRETRKQIQFISTLQGASRA